MKVKPGLLLLLVLLPVSLFASAEGEAHSATTDFLGMVVNFVVLFGGLAFVLRKPIAAMLEKRGQGIRREVEHAENDLKEAEAKRKESESRLSRLGQDIEKMRQEAALTAEAAKRGIGTQAEEEKARLKALADQEIQALIRSGIIELRAYVGDKATELSRERARKRLTPEVHLRLIDKSIDRLAGSDD